MRIQDEVLFFFTWRCILATRCPKCQALNGRVYVVNDIFQEVLMDPQFGPVWSLDHDTSLVHPFCKCSLDMEVEVDMDRNPFFNDMVYWMSDLT